MKKDKPKKEEKFISLTVTLHLCESLHKEIMDAAQRWNNTPDYVVEYMMTLAVEQLRIKQITRLINGER